MRGVVLVYDITDPRSFASVESWISEINAKAEKDVSVVLVGNKVDMVSQRRVTTAEGQELATKFSLPFFETSAKTGANLDEVFVGLAETIHKQGPKPRKHPAIVETVHPHAMIAAPAQMQAVSLSLRFIGGSAA
jgi:GTPase SAR1 family protein